MGIPSTEAAVERNTSNRWVRVGWMVRSSPSPSSEPGGVPSTERCATTASSDAQTCPAFQSGTSAKNPLSAQPATMGPAKMSAATSENGENRLGCARREAINADQTWTVLKLVEERTMKRRGREGAAH